VISQGGVTVTFGLIDLDSKYLLMFINNVTLKRQKLFMEVRDEIVKKTKKNFF